MKVLWLINVPLPIIARDCHLKVVPYGGWLVELANRISKYDDTELYICFKQSEKNALLRGNVEDITYYGFFEDVFKADMISRDQEKLFHDLLMEVQPDIIQIFGTEHLHSFVMTKACSDCGYMNRTIITVQGLVSVIARHYYSDLPFWVRYGYTLRDIFRGNTCSLRKKYLRIGNYEEEIIRMSQYVIGRTDWDRACATRLNDKIHYYTNNETLRLSFYNKTWDYHRCQKHSIFCSQAGSPIKGFHFVLEALTDILNVFPDTQVYLAGEDIQTKKSYKRTSYQQYLISYIKKKKLTDKIVFLGNLQEDQMVEAYLNANVFVCSSSIENSPNSLCEAMLLGMPVVSADVGGVKDLIEHNREGYIYQHDAPYMLAYYVKKVFAMKDEITPLCEAAKMHAMNTHCIEKNVEDLRRIYQDIALQNECE